MKGQPIYSHTCDRHQFFLRRQKDNIIDPQLLQASFCQSPSLNPLKQGEECQSCPHLDCPVFNFDCNCATPTFVLKLDRKYYECGDKVRIKHEDFPIAQSAEKSQLFEPKPKSKNNYCHVCRATYKDYRSHIRRKTHHDNISRSVFNRHILELTDRYHMKRRGSWELRGRTKMERIQPTRDEDSDLGRMAPAPVRRAGEREDAWALAPNLSNYTTQINWYDHIPTGNRPQEFAEALRGMNYEQQQQFMAYQTAFHHNLYQNFTRNASHFAAKSHHPPSHQEGRSRPITFIIIDE